MKVDVSEIAVGDRVRKNLDEGIGPLCESMRLLGQLQPVLVDDDFNLIAGARRLRACELLGIQVEIYIVKNLVEAMPRLLAERDENTCRKDFTPSEAVEIAEKLAAFESPKAAERMKAGKPSSDSDGGRTDDKVAAAVGMSRDTYRKAKAVIENGTPEIVEAMDCGAVSVNQASQIAKLPKEEQAEAVRSRPHVAHNSGENEWYSPAEYVEAAREVMGEIDCDPASSPAANERVRARLFYTAADDGRSKPWGKRVWMNPPYSQPLCGEFCERLAVKHRAGEVDEAVVLVNNATETKWFAELVNVASAAVFPHGRIKFLDPSGNAKGAPLQGQAVVYVGGNPEKFLESFGGFGWGAATLKGAC